MTGRDHQLIHSDAFAAELEAMGLDQSIFGPHLPAPIFQALVPRRAGVFDEHAHTFGTGIEPATFARASNGIYLDADGDYKIAAAGAIRPEYDASGNFLGYLFEPAITNKCTNYNANPDAALTNVVQTGAGVVSRFSNPSILETAGLSEICTDGNIIRATNVGEGGSNLTINVSGSTGNLNTHTVSCWARRVDGTDIRLRIGGGAFPNQVQIGAEFKRYSATGASPATFGVFEIIIIGEGTVEFILNQLEEYPVVTSPIITLGATGTRSADTLDWAQGYEAILDASGTVMIDWIPGFSATEPPAASGIQQFAAIHSTFTLLGYSSHPAANRITSHDGTTETFVNLGAPVIKSARYRCVVTWSGSSKTVGFSLNGGAFTFASGTYSGAWTRNLSALEVYRASGAGVAYPFGLLNLKTWNRAFSQSDIDRLFR